MNKAPETNWDEFSPSTDTKNVLKEIGSLCKRLRELEQERKEKEEELKNLDGTIRMLSEVGIPDLLNQAGLQEVKLETGERVSVKQVYTAHIKEDNWPAVKKFLEDNKEDAMIRFDIVTKFGVSEKDRQNAVTVMKYLMDSHINYNAKEYVHPMTLKSYVKNKMESGESFPVDLFGVLVINKTNIK